MSITDFSRKIKRSMGIDIGTLVLLFVIVGVGIGSFGLGVLFEKGKIASNDGDIYDSSDREEDMLILDQEDYSENKNINNKTGVYVASKNGKMYYKENCSGAGRIKEENRVWFATREEAEKSGYKLSSTCK